MGCPDGSTVPGTTRLTRLVRLNAAGLASRASPLRRALRAPRSGPGRRRGGGRSLRALFVLLRTAVGRSRVDRRLEVALGELDRDAVSGCDLCRRADDFAARADDRVAAS